MELIIRPTRAIALTVLLTGLIFGIVRVAAAGIIHVNQDTTSPTPNGTTWATAYPSVQGGLNAARSGDEVWVAAGTYRESVSVPLGVSLYGGFVGTETSRSQRNWSANRAILLGPAKSDYLGGVLDGFVVEGGSDSGVEVSGGSNTVANCTFHVSEDSIGIRVRSVNANITNCVIHEGGGGVYVNLGASATITDCTVFGNVLHGVEAYNGSAVTLANCTISGNGDGVAVYNGASATIANCIVAFNGVGISGVSSNVSLSHNDVFGNASGNYSRIADPTGTSGNISLDPRLSNPFHDVHLQPNSPCIDAGDDAMVTRDETDAYGKPRIIGKHVDIGSDESNGTIWKLPSRVWCVAATGSDSNDGLTWQTAKGTIAGALSMTQGSDEVWVARGTYRENVSVPLAVSLYGGFVGNETARSQRDWLSNLTNLDGTVTSDHFGDVLDGFIVQPGPGMGIQVEGGGTTIANCSVRFCDESDGVRVIYGAAAIKNCVVYGCGCGVLVEIGGVATVSGCAITGNAVNGVSTDEGGDAVVANCTVSANGEGVAVSNGGMATIANCVVAFNGTGVDREESYEAVTLTHNDVFGNATSDYSGIDDPTGTSGNISLDPRLSNPFHDVHLQPDSPCIDAGDDSIVTRDETDAYGKPRIIGKHVDIGSDESDGRTWQVASRVWYVTTTGSDSSDGTAWNTAKHTVGAAFALAQGTDEVWIARGTYTGLVSIPAGVSVYGGFTGNETARNQRDPHASTTALSDGSTSGSGVVTSQFVGAVLDGFAIRDAKIGISVPSGDLTVANCQVTGNTKYGISVSGGTAYVSSCIISGNSYGISGTASAANCVISENTYGTYETASVDECVISGNMYGTYETDRVASSAISGNTYGTYRSTSVVNCAVSGNTYGAYNTPSIVNCTVCSNTYGVYGWSQASNCTLAGNVYGVYVLDNYPARLTNCIVCFNGTGIVKVGATIPSPFSESDIFGNTTAEYANIYHSIGADGNISADPLFVSRAGGDFHLQPGSPCIDAGDDSAVTLGDRDLGGLPRIFGAHVDMGAYQWQPPRVPWSVSLGTTVTGGVTVAEKVAYVGGDDGRLYARSTEDGSSVVGFPVPGFPVDISAAVGAPVKLPSRPAVYYGKTGKAIYLTTDRGDVVRILPDGEVGWHVRPLTGQTVSTPAVTPEGNVYVNLSTGSGPFNNFVFKLDEATGTPLSLSPFLGYTTADNIGDFSPAANSRYLYVNAGWGSKSGLTLLNQDNLAVRSSFAGGEQCLSPLLLGSDLILASKSGKAWKMNAVTLAPDLGFGHFGVADLGTQISAAPFSDAAGNVYIGTADGRILKWVPGSGAFQPFYTATGKIAGLTIDRTAGVLGFGTSSGSFLQIPLDSPSSATTVAPGGPISTGTVYEALTDRFVVVTDTGVLSGYPSMR